MTFRAALSRLILPSRRFHTPSSLPIVEHSHIDRPFSGTYQNRYAVDLIKRTKRRQFVECLTSAAEMKVKGVQPNLIIYNAMLAAAAEDAFWLDAWAILDDMILMGIKPNTMSFNYLLLAIRLRPAHYASVVLEKMKACHVKPNAQTFAYIIERSVAEGNLELAVRQLLSTGTNDIVPSYQTVQSVISLAARNNLARLALDLVTWFERISSRRLEESAWVECLIAATETSYIDGIERCWGIVTKGFKTLLDEGICTGVLNAAARHGLPTLATEALQMLQTLKISPQEHHFAAIIEAFCQKDQVKEAILVLDVMSSSGISPRVETMEPVSEHIQKDAKKIDLTWNVVEQLHKGGNRIDIAAPRAVITATIARRDDTKTLAFYRDLPRFGLSPGLDTYNHLLRSCTRVANRQFGDVLLADMKKALVKPDRATYEATILLCLTQTFYEDAFFYLEEMKAAGYKPPAAIYISLAEKCLDSNDVRHQMVLKELDESGYIVPEELQHRLRSKEQESLSGIPKPILTDDERRFIERGGLI